MKRLGGTRFRIAKASTTHREGVMRKNVLLAVGMMSVLTAGLLLQPRRAAADPAVDTIHNVMALDASGKPAGNPVGSSRLTREDTGISVTISTSQLAPLNVYTVWWMITNPDGKTLYLGYAGGGLALPDGTASFAGHLGVGPLPAANGKTVMVSAAGAVFDNPRKVKVGFVIRTHGPIILDKLADQLTTFGGGCPPNTCKDVQTSEHAP